MGRKSRIYWREQGDSRRAYADFRDYAEYGGKREALKVPGEDRATTDPDVAAVLVAKRLEELEAAKRGKLIGGHEPDEPLGKYAEYHLKQKAKSGNVVRGTLELCELHLRRACDFLGDSTPLHRIGVQDVTDWMHALQQRPNGRGGTLSNKSVRDHLFDLSNLLRRAISEGKIDANPVAGIMDKPKAKRKEARWLEVHESALLLESARSYEPPADKHGMGFMYPLLATFVLTGGRKSEVLGLEVRDVSFDRGTVTFRPSSRRRLKTDQSHRSVPLWPQLREILLQYLNDEHAPSEGLLFPSPRTGDMVTDTRKALDAVAGRVGWSEGEIRTKMFRHTYCAARLQTLDNGHPVSVFTVASELGHGGLGLVQRVYGHLGQVRHRSEVVEYRVEQHRERLGDRLRLIA